MGRLRRWAEQRLGTTAWGQRLSRVKVPERLARGAILGSAGLTALAIQVITGLVLTTYYVPSPDHAYDSVRFIQHGITAGALLRGMHHWGASAVVVLLLAHLIRVFAIGAYKYPREANWLVGVGLFVVVMGFAFTGYLLPWDQRAYWATVVGTSIAGATPIVGGSLQTLLREGPAIGAGTLTRFFALHVLWFPAIVVTLLLVHVALVLYHGLLPPTVNLEAAAPERTGDASYAEFYRTTYEAGETTTRTLWPDFLAPAATAALAVALAIVVLGGTVGAGLEPPADPSDTSYVPRPEWYFLPLYQLMKLVPGRIEAVISIGVPAALVLTLLALPFFDTSSTRNLRRRPVALGSLVLLLGGGGLLLGSSVAHRSNETATPEALTGTQRAGRALFRAKCSSCHTVQGQGGQIGPDLSAIGLEHSTAWMHSFIEEPSRFHRQTIMLSFAPPKLAHQEIEEIAQYLSTLRGTAAPNVAPQFHDTFP